MQSTCARTALAKRRTEVLFFAGMLVPAALVFLLFLQFWSVFGAPFGYTFTVVDGARTDVNWYLGEFGSAMSFGRAAPLSIVASFGPFLGPLWICLITLVGTSLALRGIALTRGVHIDWKSAALMDLLAFPVLFHMITMGFYSQMLAGMFTLLAIASEDQRTKVVCLFLTLVSHSTGVFIVGFYLAQPMLTWLANYRRETEISEKLVAIGGAAMVLLSSRVWQPLFNHIAYTIPKTFLFLAQNAWFKMKARCPQISAWVLASLAFTFVDYNARTILFAYLLSIPFILESLNDKKIISKKMRTTWIALFFFETMLSCMWTLIFYSQFL